MARPRLPRPTDPFNTSKSGFEKQTGAVSETMIRDWNGRTVSLSFSYRFGDSDQKTRRNRSSGGGGNPGPM